MERRLATNPVHIRGVGSSPPVFRGGPAAGPEAALTSSLRPPGPDSRRHHAVGDEALDRDGPGGPGRTRTFFLLVQSSFFPFNAYYHIFLYFLKFFPFPLNFLPLRSPSILSPDLVFFFPF